MKNTYRLKIEEKPLSEKEKKECEKALNYCLAKLQESPEPTNFLEKIFDCFRNGKQLREIRKNAIINNKEILEKNSFQVLWCKPKAVVSFEQYEDEGYHYIFDIGEDTLLFIGGQDFPSNNRFPNTEFEIRKETLEMTNLGNKLKASTKICIKDQKDITKPNVIFTFPGTLETAIDSYKTFLDNNDFREIYTNGWS
jgi:hypothetical protein